MKVELDYGQGVIGVELPVGSNPTIIRKQPVAPLPNPRDAVAQALAAPVGCTSFAELAIGRRSACIVICDITRPVPNGLFLYPMVEELIKAGIAAENITILVATGLHRPNLGAELAELVADPRVLERVQVVNHDARDSIQHVDLGVTATRGTPIKLDARFVRADLKIVTGLVEPHFMAGYSGGRKVVAPGIAHEDTIRTFHSARFMAHPAAVQCNLKNNPLHEEQLEILKAVGEVYALNTVLDEKRRLTHVNFGEVVASHAQSVDFVRQSSQVTVPRRFKTVLTSAAGYPLDQTYYQTVKGMVTPIDILDEDARLLIASDCSEGLGSAEYRAAQTRLVAKGPQAFLDEIMTKSLADVDEWQTQMQLKPMRIAQISLFSRGLPEADRALTGVQMIDSLEDALIRSIEQSGDPAIAVIPEGPYVVPVYEAEDI